MWAMSQCRSHYQPRGVSGAVDGSPGFSPFSMNQYYRSPVRDRVSFVNFKEQPGAICRTCTSWRTVVVRARKASERRAESGLGRHWSSLDCCKAVSFRSAVSLLAQKSIASSSFFRVLVGFFSIRDCTGISNGGILLPPLVDASPFFDPRSTTLHDPQP